MVIRNLQERSLYWGFKVCCWSCLIYIDIKEKLIKRVVFVMQEDSLPNLKDFFNIDPPPLTQEKTEANKSNSQV